jgi:cytochrome c oxidase subunit IV
MEQHQQHSHAETHKHPSSRQYVIIGLVLAFLTALEVAAFELMTGMNSALVVWIIILLTVAKFALVVGYFMHLKFDDWRFTALFVSPLVIMASIMVALLALFHNLTR